MHPLLYTLRDIVHDQWLRAREQPVDWFLKPAVKAAVVIGLLSVAAHVPKERTYDRKALAKLSAGSKPVKAPSTTGSLRR
jgi:hypothetical protein